MTYERLALKQNISGVYSATYYVGPESTALKINETKFIGKYPSLGAAKEVVNGYLIKDSCPNPWDMSFRLKESVIYTGDNYVTQNSQSGNSVGTFFTQVAPTTPVGATGIVDTSNPNYLKLSTSNDGTANSRARLINENDVFGVLSPDVWSCVNFKATRFSITAQLETFDLNFWNDSGAVCGLQGLHNGTSFTGTGLTVEKGCVFRPNALGNWRCSWYMRTAASDTNRLFEEQAFRDTNINAFERTNLSILVNGNGTEATWLIENKPVFFVNPNSYGLKNEDTLAPIGKVIYSTNTDDGSPESINPTFKVYAGAEVRRRTAGRPQHSLLVYNTKLETIT